MTLNYENIHVSDSTIWSNTNKKKSIWWDNVTLWSQHQITHECYQSVRPTLKGALDHNKLIFMYLSNKWMIVERAKKAFKTEFVPGRTKCFLEPKTVWKSPKKTCFRCCLHVWSIFTVSLIGKLDYYEHDEFT